MHFTAGDAVDAEERQQRETESGERETGNEGMYQSARFSSVVNF